MNARTPLCCLHLTCITCSAETGLQRYAFEHKAGVPAKQR